MVPQPKYEPTLIKQVLEDRSGYPFELQITRRVETWGDYGYYVEPNYSFEDQDTGEARELDFYAIRALPISTKRDEWAFIIILGSCKASRNAYVFFTRSEEAAGVRLMSDVPISGYPLEICEDSGETLGIEWYFQLHNLLHIGKMKNISSQACVLVWNSGKWEVEKKAVIRDTFIPLVKVMARKIEDHNDECSKNDEKLSPEYNIYYPLVVLKGPMYEYYVSEQGDAKLESAKHVVVMRHYESKAVKCRCGIDVIHESYLEEYLELIEKEAKKFVNLIRRHKKVVAKSIEQLATGAKEQNSEDGGVKE